MTMINDGEGFSIGKVGNKAVVDPLLMSGIDAESFRPCQLGWWKRLDIMLPDGNGDFIECPEKIAQLDMYELQGIELAEQFQEAVNRAAGLAVNLACYHAIHNDRCAVIRLRTGVEEMIEAAKAADALIREQFPEQYLDATAE